MVLDPRLLGHGATIGSGLGGAGRRVRIRTPYGWPDIGAGVTTVTCGLKAIGADLFVDSVGARNSIASEYPCGHRRCEMPVAVLFVKRMTGNLNRNGKHVRNQAGMFVLGDKERKRSYLLPGMGGRGLSPQTKPHPEMFHPHRVGRGGDAGGIDVLAEPPRTLNGGGA